MNSNKDYKLLEHCSTIIKILKFQGLFIHRSFRKGSKIFKNKVNMEETTEKKEDYVDEYPKEIFKNNKYLEKSTINWLHLLYCLILLAIKIVGFPIISLYQLFLEQFSRGDNYNTSVSYVIRNPTFSFSSSPFVNVLLQIAFSLAFILYLMIPFYFLTINLVDSGFYRSVLCFEIIERKIYKFIHDYPCGIPNKTCDILSMYSNGRLLKKFKVIYIVCLLVVAALLCLVMMTNMKISENYGSMTTIQLLLGMFQTTSIILCSLDQMTSLYFICKNLMLIQHLTNTFYEYLNELVENKVEIAIEPIRHLYSSLYEYVKFADHWISFFYGFNYLIMIPTVCIFLYGILMGDLTLEKVQYVSPSLIFILFEMTLITSIAITVYSKVGLN